jgi:hypothetical protein
MVCPAGVMNWELMNSAAGTTSRRQGPKPTQCRNYGHQAGASTVRMHSGPQDEI